jgi:hypothetical protein
MRSDSLSAAPWLSPIATIMESLPRHRRTIQTRPRVRPLELVEPDLDAKGVLLAMTAPMRSAATRRRAEGGGASGAGLGQGVGAPGLCAAPGSQGFVARRNVHQLTAGAGLLWFVVRMAKSSLAT